LLRAVPALRAGTARTRTRRSTLAQLQSRSTSDNGYWRPTLAVACSPLDAGQTDVMTDRHDRPTADFRDTERPPMGTN